MLRRGDDMMRAISSCNKKMKTHETFKKNSGYMNVQHVTNDFLIFTLSKTVKYRDGFLEHAPQGRACRAFYFMNKGVK